MQLNCTKCGLVEEPQLRDNPPHISAYCSGCGAWLRHIRQQPDDDFTLYFGKFKDRNVKSMLDDITERRYLVWLYENATTLKQTQKTILKSLLKL